MSQRAFTLLSFVSLFFMVFHSGFSQSPADPYKYVIIPRKFDFLRKENQYRVNSQTKYLFEQNGFTTLLAGEEYPADLVANPCLGVRANVIDESNSFTTKLRVSLINCLNQEVYTSEEGRSKEKAFDKTYSEALKEAFESIAALKYQYRPEMSMKPQASPVAEAVEKEEVPAVAEDAETPAVAKVPVVTAVPEAATAPEVAAPAQVAVPAAAVTAVEEAAASYGNENISFFLIDQGDKLAAYVTRSKSGTYSKGEKIGSFEKTSLPNVYRVEWKDMDSDIEQTTGYFDDEGNLKIDVKRNGKIEVLLFQKE